MDVVDDSHDGANVLDADDNAPNDEDDDDAYSLFEVRCG